jgi:hypothetical protein
MTDRDPLDRAASCVLSLGGMEVSDTKRVRAAPMMAKTAGGVTE